MVGPLIIEKGSKIQSSPIVTLPSMITFSRIVTFLPKTTSGPILALGSIIPVDSVDVIHPSKN